MHACTHEIVVILLFMRAGNAVGRAGLAVLCKYVRTYVPLLAIHATHTCNAANCRERERALGALMQSQPLGPMQTWHNVI